MRAAVASGSIGAVINQSALVVAASGDLIETQTVLNLLQAASQAGASGLLGDGLAQLGRGLEEVTALLRPLLRALLLADAGAALFALLPNLLAGVAQLTDDASLLTSELMPGLVDTLPATAVRGKLEDMQARFRGVADLVEATLASVSPCAFRRLIEELEQLSAKTAELRHTINQPPGAAPPLVS